MNLSPFNTVFFIAEGITTATLIAIGWWILVLLGLGGSALFSGMETGCYRINRVRLHLLEHRNIRSAGRLSRLIRDPATLLGTLLIGNNAANYIGTASLGVIFASWGWADSKVIVVNALVITPLLFVFGETLPKDLFSAHSDRLMYRLAPVLVGMRWLFTICGVLPLIKIITIAIMRLIGGKTSDGPLHPRRMMSGLVKEGLGHGLMTDHQSTMVERVLALSNQTVHDEMTPWVKVERIKHTDDANAIWQLASRSRHARYPVVDAQGQIMGILEIQDALRRGRENCPTAGDMARPAISFTHKTAIRPALQKLQTQRANMAIVTDTAKRPVGIVSIKDLIEPITGELSAW